MEIQLGGPSESETSLDNINPTIDQISEQSDTESTIYRKVRTADSIQQAHAELGMSFSSTPNTSTELAIAESPLTKFCKQICYEVVDSDDAGITDNTQQDIYVKNETRRFKTAELTPEVHEDITLIRQGLPPIGTAFFRAGEQTPSESPKPESFQATPEILPPEPYQVPHDQI